MPPTVKRLGRRAVKVTRADINEAWGGQNTGRCKVTRAGVNEAWGGQNTGRCKGILKESRGLRGVTFYFGLGGEVAEGWAERSREAASGEVESVRFRD